MKVLIDLCWMAIGDAGGMEQASFELIAAIASINQEDHFVLYCPRRTYEEWVFRKSFKHTVVFSDECLLIPEFAIYDVEGRSDTQKSRRLGFTANTLDETGEVGVLEIDLVHSTQGFTSEELLQYPNILTVYDLQHLHYPDFFSQEDRAERERRLRVSMEAAERIVCISEFVRADVCRNYPQHAGKTSALWIIPSGHAWLKPSTALVKRTLKGLGVANDYLFYPAHPWAHKNHLRLIEAFAKLKELRPEPLQLIMTGRPFEKEHPVLGAITTLNLEASARHLGFCTPLEIRCLLEGAKALVFPSLFEGFGLPIAEAILAGTPVVCSNIEALTEVGGDSIVVFDPYDSDDMAAKILETIDNPTSIAFLKEASKRRRKVFSPESIALQMCNLYREASGQKDRLNASRIHRGRLRYERARHWKRLSKEAFDGGNWGLGVRRWLRLSFHSPRLAWRSLSRLFASQKAGLSSEPFTRYSDSWIGPRFRDYLFAPENAKELEIALESAWPEGPPSIVARVSLGGEPPAIAEIRQNGVSLWRARVPDGMGDLVSLDIQCSRHFVPLSSGLSEDERQLSLKLVGIRWIL